ncbi:unnamed protein product [Citrullus colocynthis]|uniref:Uncharacterized protein n=1 Tax=Citrullus colocynthis TaxID=252529 RepID=A0ABP0YNZ0_9ROSI
MMWNGIFCQHLSPLIGWISSPELSYLLEIGYRETIKPLFSTPSKLGLHHLCLSDRQAPFFYLQFLYFYENTSNSKLLKESLSKALTLYYPFAGRLKDRASIDCNDMGVTFLEAKLRCPMSEFMNADDSRRKEILKLLCFDDMNGKDQRFNPLLCIQLTRFECEGEAICVFLSDKLADTLTFTNFMSHLGIHFLQLRRWPRHAAVGASSV